MRLHIPSQAPSIQLMDIHGNPVVLKQGQPTLLTFFGDINCPWTIKQLNDINKRYANLALMGLTIIAVSSSSAEEIHAVLQNQRFHFSIVSEENGINYQSYGVQNSIFAKNKALFLRFYDFLTGLRQLGFKNLPKALISLFKIHCIPANFLIDDKGQLVDAYYGKDAGDYIPPARVEVFLTRCLIEYNRNFTAAQ